LSSLLLQQQQPLDYQTFFQPPFLGSIYFFSLVESKEQGENVESIFHLIIIAYSGTKNISKLFGVGEKTATCFA
jgi:hypothetical protein